MYTRNSGRKWSYTVVFRPRTGHWPPRLQCMGKRVCTPIHALDSAQRVLVIFVAVYIYIYIYILTETITHITSPKNHVYRQTDHSIIPIQGLVCWRNESQTVETWGEPPMGHPDWRRSSCMESHSVHQCRL